MRPWLHVGFLNPWKSNSSYLGNTMQAGDKWACLVNMEVLKCAVIFILHLVYYSFLQKI